jgi:murein L,D-transpeptidase YafK
MRWRGIITAGALTVFVGALYLPDSTGLRKIHGFIQNAEAQVMPAASITLPYPSPPPAKEWDSLPAAERLADVRRRLQPQLNAELATRSLALGQPAFIRIFKETNELELWLQPKSGARYQLFRSYPIALFSGYLGPKTREGDMQAPEGFYSFGKSLLNPASRYHLAFNIGYPNAYDRHHERTGSLIMVHGRNVSIGCFAMTDPVIEEIYLIIEAALDKGQAQVPVHIFPFRMTPARLEKARLAADAHCKFWCELQAGHDHFEAKHFPPAITIQAGKYQLQP